MDFSLALIISGLVTAVLLSIALIVYGFSVKRILNDVTPNTRKALISFGFAGLLTVIVTLTGIIDSRLQFAVMGIFFALMVSTILYVLYPEGSRAKKGRYLAFIISIIMIIENQLVLHGYLGSSMFQYMGLTILIISSFTLSFILVRDTPSSFTASVLLILILYLFTGVTAITHFTFNNPEYFIVQSLPIIISVAVYASISRPWRSMISIFLIAFAISLGSGLIIGALLVGNSLIWQYTLVALIASLFLISPLNYFVQQGAETGARTPRLIGYVLIALCLLILSHTNSWAVYVVEMLPKPAMAWNISFVAIDTILGTIAIVCFVLAGAAANFGEKTYSIIHNALLIAGTTIAMIGMYTIRDIGEVNDVYPLMLGLIFIGILLFIKISVKIYRIGAKRAAANFMTFIISSLAIGLAVMFSDQLPFLIFVILLAIASILALASNPLLVSSISKRFRRKSHEEITNSS